MLRPSCIQKISPSVSYSGPILLRPSSVALNLVYSSIAICSGPAHKPRSSCDSTFSPTPTDDFTAHSAVCPTLTLPALSLAHNWFTHVGNVPICVHGAAPHLIFSIRRLRLVPAFVAVAVPMRLAIMTPPSFAIREITLHATLDTPMVNLHSRWLSLSA